MNDISKSPALDFGDRVLLKAMKSRSMLKLFVNHVWNSTDNRIRDRLFRFLGDARDADFVYTNRGPERYMVHSKDRVIGREVFLSGQFDFDKVTGAFNLLARHTGQEKFDTLIDVGANIGTICIPAVARRLVERAIAIEPDPLNSRLLRINALLNSLEDRIVIHQCAVGERDGATLTLEQSGDNWGDHRISVSAADGAFGEAGRHRIDVRSGRLDSVVQPPGDDTGMLIWMDTQGYEGFVLQGATALLARQIPVVSEFWPYGMNRAGSFPAFRAALASYRGFVDLNAKGAGDLRPIGEMDDLFRSMDTGKDSFTDILLV